MLMLLTKWIPKEVSWRLNMEAEPLGPLSQWVPSLSPLKGHPFHQFLPLKSLSTGRSTVPPHSRVPPWPHASLLLHSFAKMTACVFIAELLWQGVHPGHPSGSWRSAFCWWVGGSGGMWLWCLPNLCGLEVVAPARVLCQRLHHQPIFFIEVNKNWGQVGWLHFGLQGFFSLVMHLGGSSMISHQWLSQGLQKELALHDSTIPFPLLSSIEHADKQVLATS